MNTGQAIEILEHTKNWRKEMEGYWNNTTEVQPHTAKFMAAAELLLAERDRKIDENIRAQRHVWEPAEIEALLDEADNLRRWALQPLEIYEADDCNCVTPEQSCPTCRARAAEVYGGEL